MIYFSFVRAILRQCVKLFCVVRLFFKPLCRCAIVVDLFLSLFVRRCSTIRCCFVSLCRPAARHNVCVVRLVFLFLSSCECCVPRAHERGSFVRCALSRLVFCAVSQSVVFVPQTHSADDIITRSLLARLVCIPIVEYRARVGVARIAHCNGGGGGGGASLLFVFVRLRINRFLLLTSLLLFDTEKLFKQHDLYHSVSSSSSYTFH